MELFIGVKPTPAVCQTDSFAKLKGSFTFASFENLYFCIIFQLEGKNLGLFIKSVSVVAVFSLSLDGEWIYSFFFCLDVVFIIELRLVDLLDNTTIDKQFIQLQIGGALNLTEPPVFQLSLSVQRAHISRTVVSLIRSKTRNEAFGVFNVFLHKEN